MAVAVVRHPTRLRTPAIRPRVAELPCECARPTCSATIPARAEAYRGRVDRRMIVPAHFSGDGVVIRAADAFFVVGTEV
jgi:hypothetical protein